MNENHRASAARALIDAYTAGPIQPLSAGDHDITIEDAYAIQLAQVSQWLAEGRVLAGAKVGLTSLAVQQQLGVDQPDFGHLFADTFHLSGSTIPVDTFLQPRIEPEIAFVLKQDLKGPGVTVAQALQAVDHVLASLEVVDSRIVDWRITISDTVADNASSGGVVLGTRPQPIDAVDLRLLGVVVFRNGRLVSSGAGAAAMGSPINALVWLANTLGTLGTTLAAGSVVLPGAMTPMIPAAPGDVVTANFAGLGSVTARFARDASAKNP